MTKTTFRRWATGSLFLVAAVHANAGDRKLANRHSLTVQLLNLAGVKATELKKAVAEASWIFNKAGVNLAYTMVHEIAHLILGSTAHGATGIMRANCGPGELKAVSQRRLLFRSWEIKALHRKLVERSGGLEIAGSTRIPSPLP